MEKLTLYQKLLVIQDEVDGFTKGAKGHNYEYVDGNQVLSKIRPLMTANKLLLKQEVVKCENTIIDYNTKHGSKKEVLSSVQQKFTWIDTETLEREECLFHANGMNDFDKGLGSALTYGERYFLLKFFHVPTDGDDPDALGKKSEEWKNKNSGQKQTAPSNTPELPWLNEGTEEYKKVEDHLKTSNATIANVKKRFKVSKSTEDKLDHIIKTRNSSK